MRKSFLWIGTAILILAAIVATVLAGHHGAPAPIAQATAPTPASPPPTADPQPVGPGGFVPLQSQAVKDAIHRALVSGTTQRWQDGGLSGYAVPSTTTGANGCRAIRYTIDQTPDAPYGSITACDASEH